MANWICEIYADFNGGKLLYKYGGTHEDLLNVINNKVEGVGWKKDDPYHPSWEKRKKYLETKTFNEELIRQVAAETECTDEDLIGKAISSFPTVNL